MAFNEESSRGPSRRRGSRVISPSAQTDTTIADFAADLRAPTPTAAAEWSVPVRAQL